MIFLILFEDLFVLFLVLYLNLFSIINTFHICADLIVSWSLHKDYSKNNDYVNYISIGFFSMKFQWNKHSNLWHSLKDLSFKESFNISKSNKNACSHLIPVNCKWFTSKNVEFLFLLCSRYFERLRFLVWMKNRELYSILRSIKYILWSST